MDDPSTYSFASDPRAVAPARAKYRPEASAGSLQQASTMSGTAPNIMQDPRVWRGSTYAGAAVGHKHASLATQQQQGGGATAALSGTANSTRRRRRRKKGTGRTGTGIYDLRPAARRHIEVSLEEHLIEPEQVTAEVEVTTQTDAFEESPETPTYVPKKTGIDQSTQIEAGELFDFDREVEPILDIIMGKTLEQALLEVEEEEELIAIEGRKQGLLEGKAEEAQRIAGMEEAAKREFAAKEQRRKRAIEAVRAKETARRKVAATSAGQDMAVAAMHAALGALHREGKFSNPLQDEIQHAFMPWLLDRVQVRLQDFQVANVLRDELVHGAVARGQELREAELARLAAIEAEKAAKAAEERRTYVRVFVKVMVGEGEDAKETMVGPIRVKRAYTVEQVEASIQQWLQEHPVGDDFELPGGSLNLTFGGNYLEKSRSLLDQALPDDAALELGKAPEEEGEGEEEA